MQKKETEIKQAVEAEIEFNTPDQELQKVKTHQLEASPAVAGVNALSPFQQMQQAHSMGMSLPEMKEMLEIQKDWEANEARKAFHLSLAEFKKNPPKIVKDMQNKQYDSSYTSIGNMVNGVNEAMGPFGLNARWDYPESSDPNVIIVKCILAHKLGHEESVTLPGPPDKSGAKNPLQERKSTRTYLKLETFEAVTGMASAAGNLDDDGNSYITPKYITEDQQTAINDLIKEVKADKAKFLVYLNVDSIDKCEAQYYDRAIKALEAKRK